MTLYLQPRSFAGAAPPVLEVAPWARIYARYRVDRCEFLWRDRAGPRARSRFSSMRPRPARRGARRRPPGRPTAALTYAGGGGYTKRRNPLVQWFRQRRVRARRELDPLLQNETNPDPYCAYYHIHLLLQSTQPPCVVQQGVGLNNEIDGRRSAPRPRRVRPPADQSESWRRTNDPLMLRLAHRHHSDTLSGSKVPLRVNDNLPDDPAFWSEVFAVESRF